MGAATADARDEAVREWIGTVLGPVEIAFDPPRDDLAGSGVNAYLLDLESMSPVHQADRRSLLVMLRYLVSTWAQTPGQAHRHLGKLFFAASEHPEFAPQTEPVAPALWAALGVRPRPSFLLRVPLRHVRTLPVAKRVTAESDLVETALRALRGRVLGPGGIPLARATVRIPSYQLAATTDARGEFHFPAVPTEPASVRVVVRARGMTLEVSERLPEDEGRAMVIRFDNLET